MQINYNLTYIYGDRFCQESCTKHGVFEVVQFNGVIEIYTRTTLIGIGTYDGNKNVEILAQISYSLPRIS